MGFGTDRPLGRWKWQYITIYVALIAVVLLAVIAGILLPTREEEGRILQILWLLAALVLLVTVILILSKTFTILRSLAENNAKLEKVTETLEKNRSVLTQISQNTRLSETVKAIAFRDADMQSLRDAVFDKLQQKDFDAAYESAVT
jgi:glucan phosphoethanolaminetransferase (alkaline phosphatase superfamily)